MTCQIHLEVQGDLDQQDFKRNISMNKKEPVYKFVQNTLKNDPRTFLKAVLIVFLVNIFITLLFDNATYGFIALVLTILSLSEIFFTYKYILYDDMVVIDRFFYKVKHEYTYYKKISPDRNGVFLSPYRISTRMESFRGVLLRIPKDKREDVIDFLKTKINITENKDEDAETKEQIKDKD